jgi:hypothetical protein
MEQANKQYRSASRDQLADWLAIAVSRRDR